MTDGGRESSAVWTVLSRSARKTFKAISDEINAAGGASAAVRYLDLEARGCSTNTLSVTLKSLTYLGLIDRRPGPHLGVIYSRSHRWKDVTDETAQRLLQLAREAKSAA
jgi:DNA-binding HxlR family transcriptional regulator